MMDYCFVRTRHVYDSYQDFWEMVRLANLPTCYVDEIDINADCVYVTTPLTGELKSRTLPKDRRARIIWWNLERPDGEYAGNFTEVVTEALLHVDDIWVSDRYYQTWDPRLKFVVMGSHPDLRVAPGPATHYDIAHYSYCNGRRNHTYGKLQELSLSLAPNGWGAERAAGLLHSKIFLNVHQTDALIGEPLRFAVAAAYSTNLVSESLADPYPLVPGTDFSMAEYDDLPWVVKHMADMSLMLAGGRDSLYKRLCVEHRFPQGALRQLAIGGY